jgi:hypothetical protein
LGLGRQRHMRLGLKRARQAGRGCNGNPFQHHGSVCTTRLEPEGSAPRQEGRERRAMVTCDWLGSNLASTATLDCQPNELHGDISNRVAHTTCAPDCWAAQRGELGEEVLAEGEAAHDRTAGERVQMVHACCSRTRRARSDPPTPGHNRPPRARCKCSPAARQVWTRRPINFVFHIWWRESLQVCFSNFALSKFRPGRASVHAFNVRC